MKILWFSRHDLTVDQLADLQRIYGDVEIKRADGTVSSWKEIADLGADCDVLAVVLPPNLLGDLVNPRNNQKPVIRAKANRVPTGNMMVNAATGKEETEYRFEHAGWEQVLRIEVVTKAL